MDMMKKPIVTKARKKTRTMKLIKNPRGMSKLAPLKNLLLQKTRERKLMHLFQRTMVQKVLKRKMRFP
jgi:hypothetical protein